MHCALFNLAVASAGASSLTASYRCSSAGSLATSPAVACSNEAEEESQSGTPAESPPASQSSLSPSAATAMPGQRPLFAHLPGNMSAPEPAAQLLDHQPAAAPSAALAAAAAEAELATVSTMAAVAAAAAAAAAWREVRCVQITRILIYILNMQGNAWQISEMHRLLSAVQVMWV